MSELLRFDKHALRKCYGVLFVIVVAGVAHLLFSWRGFNPTDEGFVIAGTRRLLDGSIPHRDFIFVRPTLPMFLHIPEVALGGDYIFWLARLVFWIEQAWMSWLWIGIIATLTEARELRAYTKMLLAFLVFCISTQTFPMLAWYTTDALLLYAAGLSVAVHAQRNRTKFFGYVLIGAAVLCKQNFAPLIPVTLLLLGDWKRVSSVFAAFLPALLYGLYLLVNGALGDAILQTTATHGLFQYGVMSYVRQLDFWEGIFLGGAFVFLRWDLTHHSSSGKILPSLCIVLIWICVAFFPIRLALHFVDIRLSFGLFGMCVVAALLSRDRRLFIPGMLACAAAWTASISVGTPTPMLGAGPILAVLLVYLWTYLPSPASLHAFRNRWIAFMFSPINRGSAPMVLLFLAVWVGMGFGVFRWNFPYLDDASKLTKPLGEVLPGGKMIWTNPNTYAMLEDLQRIRSDLAPGTSAAVLPDLPAYWVTATESNPLPSDWPCFLEIPEQVNERVKDAIASHGKVGVFIISKFDAITIAHQRAPFIGPNEQWDPKRGRATVIPEALQSVREQGKKIRDTEFFQVFTLMEDSAS